MRLSGKLIALLVSGLVVVLAVVLFLVNYRVQIVSKSSQVVTVEHVCTDKIINDFNAGMTSDAPYTNTSKDADRIKPVYQQVIGSQDYTNDPTCVYIVLRYELLNRDATQAQSYYNTLTDLSNKGENVSNLVENQAGRASLQQDIQALQNVSDNGTG